MIVENIGYLKKEDVINLFSSSYRSCVMQDSFSIYKTHKNTCVLVKGTTQTNICLSNPKKDRLPWKITEGKKIISGEKIFDSKLNKIEDLETINWNNGNQIIAYEEYIY